MKKTIYQGREFRSVADLLRFLKIPKCTYDSRKQKGLPTDKLLSTCSLHKRKAVKDPVTGKCYKSVGDYCQSEGITRSGWRYRRKKRFIVRRYRRTCVYQGIKYESINALARAMGISKAKARYLLNL